MEQIKWIGTGWKTKWKNNSASEMDWTTNRLECEYQGGQWRDVETYRAVDGKLVVTVKPMDIPSLREAAKAVIEKCKEDEVGEWSVDIEQEIFVLEQALASDRPHKYTDEAVDAVLDLCEKNPNFEFKWAWEPRTDFFNEDNPYIPVWDAFQAILRQREAAGD